MNESRKAFLKALIGKPYKLNAKGPEAFDCWHVVKCVRETLFDDVLPDIEVPKDPSLLWLGRVFRDDAERKRWEQTEEIADGNLVLMSRATQAVHIGIWLAEGGVLHAVEVDGVVFQDIPVLRASGWGHLRFFKRANANS